VTPRTREAVRYSLGVFAVVRLALFLLGLIEAGLVHPLHPVSVAGWPAPPVADGWHAVFTAWERQDALWFLRIASGGYRVGDGSAAFFPVYPLLIRAASFATGAHPLAGATIVSNACFAAALCVAYALTARERSTSVARTTVLLLAVFPTSFFFFAPYSEPVFLLFVVTAFVAARTDRWWLAGGAAALAAATRSVGIVLAPALAVEAVHQRLERGRWRWASIAACLGPAVGAGLYSLYWYERTGDALASLHAQADWQRTASWPWTTLVSASQLAWEQAGRGSGAYWAIDWLVVVPVLAVCVWAAARYRPSYGVYVWTSVLIPLCYVFEPRPLMSMPRFVLPLFPAFWAIAELAERWHVPRAAIVAVAAAGLGCLSLLFVNWYYIF
jgi:Gpi18-like mannosyltransferase